MKCQDCGTEENVELTSCPYAKEVDEEDVKVWLCEDCLKERADNI